MRESRAQKAAKFTAALADNSAKVDFIPSKKDLGIREERKHELVAPYCRVSTMSDGQVESYIMQKEQYTSMVSQHPNWTLVDVYADEGISATSMKNRKEFLRLIEDCKAGKVTRIITKSVSRIARNVVDGISTVRMLRALPTPVGIYFETEHIDSLSRESDSQLSLLASFAESESLNKSLSVKWAIRNRFGRHIPRICDTYGFNRNGLLLTPDPVTAHIVSYIYELLLDGFSPHLIAQHLTAMGIPTPTQKSSTWTGTAVSYILSNEKNCGDAAMQKTVTVDVFTHKSVRNTGQERYYIIRDHHQGIVTRDIWERAQAILGSYLFRDYLLYEEDSQVILGEEYHVINAKKGWFNEHI